MSATIFPFPANWAAEIAETEEWLTDVLEAWDGTEQRLALRSYPVRTLEYDLLIHEPAELAQLQHLLAAPRSRELGVPWWPDASDLASTLASGSTVVPVPTSGRGYAAGEQLLFHDRKTTCEAKTIQTVGADSVTLTTGTTGTWPAGSYILPVRTGLIADAQDLTHLTDTAAELRVKFECRNAETISSGSGASQYRSLPVLGHCPEPGGKQTLKWLANVVDSKTGARSIDDRRQYPTPAHQLQFVGLNRTEIETLRTFFRAMQGRVGTFWRPSWRADLVLHAAAAAGASVIQIEPCGYTDYAWGSAALRDIQLQSYDGTVQWRRITGATEASGHEVLNLGSPLSSAVSPGACLVSYLTLCRQASDTLTIGWHSTEIATTTVEVAEIPWEVPA